MTGTDRTMPSIQHRFAPVLLAAALALPLATGAAHARGNAVAANKTTEVGFAWAIDARTCGNLAKPKITLGKPKHGQATAKWVTRRVVGASGAARKCNGRTAKGMAIYYTPGRGFRGQDGFRVRVRNRLDGRARTMTDYIVVDVR